MQAARMVFGAHGQLAVGILTFVGAVAAWIYGATLTGEPLVRFIFHASMAALCIAAYAIIATALGYRATERVEAEVIENIEHADDVDVEFGLGAGSAGRHATQASRPRPPSE